MKKKSNQWACYNRIWSLSPMPCGKHGPRDSVDKNRGRRPRFLLLLRPEGHDQILHQIPSIKVLFKTNTKGHKHPSIRLLSKSKTQLVNQRKQKVAFSPGTAHSPEIRSYRTWWGAASPILNDTPVVYTTYNRTRIRNAYIYICIFILTQSFWTGTNVIRRKRIVQPTGFGACSSTCCQWDGEDVPAPWDRSNSHPPVRVQKSCVNPFI